MNRTVALHFAGGADGVPPGSVRLKGKLFQAGEYLDKSFSLTREEMESAAAAFVPIPLNLEHLGALGVETLLDGRLGWLTRIWTDGDSLFGEADVPPWLREAMAGAPLRVSCEWDRDSKTLAGLALVALPRVADAALMARLKASRNESCDAGVCPREELARVSFRESVMNWLGAGAPNDDVPDPDGAGGDASAPAAPPEETAAFAALLRTRDAEIAQMKAERAQMLAAARADEAVRDGHAVPAEREALAALFAQALHDDEQGSAACFGASGASRVAMLHALLDARPASLLCLEALQPADPAAAGRDTLTLLNCSDTPQVGDAAPPDSRRRLELHRLTPMGQAFLSTDAGRALSASAR
ncbi:MAG: hypothetical protein KGJ62_15155 [Armatimonadetes bacterium]|nr:hypothetical protein [Armatimonadota bacterium]MDE2206284.1 hypothetical protein [Armatimonadota bacterium]